MFKEDAKEIVAFAFRGPLLQPQVQAREGEFGLVVDSLDEAFRVYFLPLDKPDEAEQLKLAYLPDVAAQQHKSGVLGSEPFLTVRLLMHERIRIAVACRVGHSNPKLATEVEGALCEILDGRLVQGKKNQVFEDMFRAYKWGYWPCGMIEAGKEPRLVVYSGGIVLDQETVDLPH